MVYRDGSRVSFCRVAIDSKEERNVPPLLPKRYKFKENISSCLFSFCHIPRQVSFVFFFLRY